MNESQTFTPHLCQTVFSEWRVSPESGSCTLGKSQLCRKWVDLTHSVSSAHFCVEKGFSFSLQLWKQVGLDSLTRPVPHCSLLSPSKGRAQQTSEVPRPFVEGPSALLLPPRARGYFVKILQEHRKSTVAFAKTQWSGLREDRD